MLPSPAAAGGTLLDGGAIAIDPALAEGGRQIYLIDLIVRRASFPLRFPTVRTPSTTFPITTRTSPTLVEQHAQALTFTAGVYSISTGIPDSARFNPYTWSPAEPGWDEDLLEGRTVTITIDDGVPIGPTENGPWSNLLSNPTRDSLWSNLVSATAPTFDGFVVGLARATPPKIVPGPTSWSLPLLTAYGRTCRCRTRQDSPEGRPAYFSWTCRTRPSWRPSTSRWGTTKLM